MRLYTCVILNSDRFLGEGIERGRIGVIIEQHNEKVYEVDFSNDSSGITTLAVLEDEMEEIK